MKFCPYAQRAHLVLDAKKIPYNVCFINLSEKPEWFSKVSALLKVPGRISKITCQTLKFIKFQYFLALEFPGDEGNSLIESLIICDFLDEKYPESRLHSDDPLQRARDKILVERFNAFIGPYYRILTNHKTDGAPGAISELTTALDVFEDELKKRGTKFFGGDSKPGMLDYMIWPWCERTGKRKL